MRFTQPELFQMLFRRLAQARDSKSEELTLFHLFPAYSPTESIRTGSLNDEKTSLTNSAKSAAFALR